MSIDSVLVTVVLPTYNRAESLPRSIRSVLCQSHKNIELIIVDDRSTDNTADVVRSFNDDRISYVANEHARGPAGARNHGLHLAKGELVAFQDSDDEWLLQKIENQTRSLLSAGDDCGAVFGGKILYGSDASLHYGEGLIQFVPAPKLKKVSGHLTDFLMFGNFISPQTVLARTDLLRSIGGFDERLRSNEDWEFALRLSMNTKINYSGEPVVVAFVSSDSISRNQIRSAFTRLVVLRKHWSYFKKNRSATGPHLFSVGRALMKHGKSRSGRTLILKSIKFCPWKLKFYVGYLLTLGR